MTRLLRALLIASLLVLVMSVYAQLASGAWPKAHGTSKNTSLSAFSGATYVPRWVDYFIPVKSYALSPAVSSTGTLYFQSTDGDTYSLDGRTGLVNWLLPIVGSDSGVPAIGTDGTVYIGSAGGPVCAIDGSTGAILWQFMPSGTGDETTGSPAIGPDGTIYVWCEDGTLYALDGKTGNSKWSFAGSGDSLQSNAVIECPAITADGDVIIAIGNTIYDLNGGTGKVNWTFPTTNETFTSMSIGADGTVYVGSSSGILFALNGSTGLIKWTYGTGSNIVSTPGVGSNGEIYIGCDNSNVYAVDASTGNLVWIFTADSPIVSSPAIAADGTIYIGSKTTFFALNGSTGAQVWSYVSTGPFCDPAIGPDGSVYVSNRTGAVYAFASGIVPVSLTVNPSTVLGGAPSTGTVTMTAPAPSNGIVVILSSDAPSVTVPASVTVPPGQISATFPIETSVVFSSVTAHLSASYNSVTQSANLTVNPIVLVSASIAPTSVQGGSSAVGTVVLNEAAPVGGALVNLTSSSNNCFVPGSVTVPQGQTSANFNIATAAVFDNTVATVRASMASGAPCQANLTILAPSLVSLVFNPSTVPGGTPSTGTLAISSIAPLGGLIVSLSTNNGVISLPTSITVSAGQTSVAFKAVTNFEINQVSTVVTATVGTQSVSGNLTITPSALVGLSVNPSNVAGGAPSVGMITLSHPAPTGGTLIPLTCNTSGIVLPGSVTVPSGATSLTFPIQTPLVVKQFVATITASLAGITQQATLTLNPLALVSFTLSSQTVSGGANVTGTLTLNGPAQNGGFTVALSSSSSAATVPGSVTVPQGQMATTFQVTTAAVTAQTSATVTATLNGQSPITAQLTIIPAVLVTVAFSPPSVTGGETSIGTVTLSGIAPNGGLTASLATTSTAATIPSLVTIAAGQNTATFVVHTAVVSQPLTASIVVKLKSITLATSLAILPTAIQSITLNPPSVAGGASSSGTVMLSGPAPKGGIVVKLQSNVKSATVPSTVAIAANKTSASFTVKTVAVATQVIAEVTGTTGVVSAGATLTINSPTLISISLSPASVTGGKSSTGTVTIGSPAPAGGLVVMLASSQSVASLPSVVTIPAGQATVKFTVKTSKVTSKTTTAVSATLAGLTKTATLIVS